MYEYLFTISENGKEDFVSTGRIKANSWKEARSYAQMQKTKYFQKVEVRRITKQLKEFIR